MRIVVTAGPTREHLDPVRFLSNPSTGKMGFAIAAEAARRGHDVTLIAGPVARKTPKGVKRIDVVSAREMLAAAMESCFSGAGGANCSSFASSASSSSLASSASSSSFASSASSSSLASSAGSSSFASRDRPTRPTPPTVFIATAAVADWRPAKCAAKKLKKGEMSPTLKLVRNPDILKTISARGRKTGDVRLVGFAAETNDVLAEAARKCREKGLSFIVANDVTEKGSGFGTDTNRVTFVFPDGTLKKFPLMTKRLVAKRILDEVSRL